MYGFSRITNESKSQYYPDRWVVWDKNFHEIEYESTEIEDCKKYLEQQARQERAQCGTGGCED